MRNEEGVYLLLNIGQVMGVPSFFAWWKRYQQRRRNSFIVKRPKVAVATGQRTDYHRVYIDLNCLAHPVARATTGPPTPQQYDSISRNVVQELFALVDVLLKDLPDDVNAFDTVFIAIDGVAPVAKMQQQRERRLKAATSAEKNYNMISPGTVFMDRLQALLERACVDLFNSGRAKHVVLSGHNIAGEGEHKIMDELRSLEKRKEDGAVQHVYVYSQDADLLFLTALNAPNVLSAWVVRQVFTGAKQRGEQELFNHDYEYVSINVFVNEIVRLVCPPHRLHRVLKAPEKEETLRYVLDYTAMCMMFGNDFMPNVPSLVLRTSSSMNRLTTAMRAVYTALWKVNKRPSFIVVPSDDACYYEFHRVHLTAILHELEKVEDACMVDHAASRKKAIAMFERRRDLSEEQRKEFIANAYEDTINAAEGQWKRRYYAQLFKFPTFTNVRGTRRLTAQTCDSYLSQLIWAVNYYTGAYDNDFNGYLYKWPAGPCVSDLHAFVTSCHFQPQLYNKNRNQMPEPVSQLTQLMCIFPKKSADLVPCKKLRWYMRNRDSPIAWLYPEGIRVDKSLFYMKTWEYEARHVLPWSETAVQDVQRIVAQVGQNPTHSDCGCSWHKAR